MSYEQGLGLVDIAIPTEAVNIGPYVLHPRGISIADVFLILQRFPILQEAVLKGGMDFSDAIVVAPQATGPILAASMGQLGNADAEIKLGDLSMEAQLDMLEAIGRLTFRSGFGPFVKRIARILFGENVVRSENPGKASDTTLPPPLKPSLEPDTATMPSGE
jgi:hypothetical protein